MTLRQAIAADARAATPIGILALVAVVVLLFFEWGAGNETIQVTAMASTYDTYPTWPGVGAVFVVGTLVALAIQCCSGLISSTGYGSLSNVTGVARAFLLRVRPELEGKNWWTLGMGARFLLAWAVGTSAVVLMQQTTTGVSGFLAHRRAIAQSAVLNAVGTGATGAVLAGAAQAARQIPALEGPVDGFISFASSPIPWFVLFTGLAVIAWYRSRPDAGTATGEPAP